MSKERRMLTLAFAGLAGVVIWGALSPRPSAASPSARFNPKVALLTYDVAAGTEGGSNTGGTWTTRSLNTEAFDPDNIVTLSANRFTLKAGKYLVEAQQTIFDDIGIPKGFRGRLRNITDNLTAGVSLSVRLHEETNESATISCPIPATLLDLTKDTTFELQYFCESTDTNARGLGYPLPGSGEVERYASVSISKLD